MILPSLLVTDTNIWIDLKNGNVLELVFDLPFHYITSVFAGEEIPREEWELLISLGVEAHALTSEQISEVFQLRQDNHSVSPTDLSSFVLARDLSAILLNSDGPLRRLAENYGIEVHGVLWLLDELVEYQILPASQAASVLIRMRAKGARLPEEECKKRLRAWHRQICEINVSCIEYYEVRYISYMQHKLSVGG